MAFAFTRLTPSVLLLVASVLTGCGEGNAAPKKGPAVTIASRLAACTPRSATLVLIEEALMTRTGVTVATAAGHAKPIEIPAGDPRLARLTTMLSGLESTTGGHGDVDVRTLVRLSCADGSELVIAGSATDPDGKMNLVVGGAAAAVAPQASVTATPLRRQLDTLVAGH